MPSAGFYVDGFNLYHSLKGSTRTAKALWLDLRALCAALKSPKEELGKVVYFSALTHWNRDKMLRHQTFLSALRHSGVEIVLGRFSNTQRECGLCGKLYPTNEEKETDVNISTRILQDAVNGVHDTFYILTGDSDQVPTIKAVKALAPGRELVSVFSVNRHSAELKQAAHRSIQLNWKHFVRNQFPNPIVLGEGRTLHCPPTWVPR